MKLAALLAAALVAACGSEKEHPPASAGCGDVAPCTSIGGGGGGSDAGGDAVSDVADAASDSDAAAPITGFVHDLRTSYANPVSDPTGPASNVTVRGLALGGGTATTTTALDGSFTLGPVAENVGAPTYFDLLRSGFVVTVAGAWLPSVDPVRLPVFDENLASTTALRVGIVLADNSAVVVVHVFDRETGAPLAGVSADLVGTARPYYDDGSDVAPGGTATGSKGTIVFLGGTTATNPFPVTLSYLGTKRGTLLVPVTVGTVGRGPVPSWVPVYIDTSV